MASLPTFGAIALMASVLGLAAGCDDAPASETSAPEVQAAPEASVLITGPGSGRRKGAGQGARGASAPGQGQGKGDGAKSLGAGDDDESRCEERIRKRFVVEWQGNNIIDAPSDEAVDKVGKLRVGAGRHAGKAAIGVGDLASLAPEAGRAEVVPCVGPPMTFDLAQASADPDHFFFVPAKRGAFKLMDRDGDAKKPLLKNIALVRLLP